MNTMDSTRFQLKIVLVDSMIPPNTHKRARFKFISVFGIIISVFIRAEQICHLNVKEMSEL